MLAQPSRRATGSDSIAAYGLSGGINGHVAIHVAHELAFQIFGMGMETLELLERVRLHFLDHGRLGKATLSNVLNYGNDGCYILVYPHLEGFSQWAQLLTQQGDYRFLVVHIGQILDLLEDGPQVEPITR